MVKVYCSECGVEVTPIAEDYEEAEETGEKELYKLCIDCEKNANKDVC